MAAGPALSCVIYAAIGNGNLTTLALSDTDLTISSSIPACGANPSWLTNSKDLLYCSNEGTPGSLSSFTKTAAGLLTPEAVVTTNGGDVSSTLYAGGRFIALAHYGHDGISTYKLPITNTSKPVQNLTFPFLAKGPNPRQIKGYPHEVITCPMDKYLFSPDLGADIVRVFSIDNSTGLLTQLNSSIILPPGSGPRHMAFYKPSSSTGNNTNTNTGVSLTKPASYASHRGPLFIYVVSELTNQIFTFSMDFTATPSTTSSLKPKFTKFFDPILSLPDGTNTTSSYIAEARVFGDFLYVSNRGDAGFGPDGDSIAMFKIDSRDGSLSNRRFFPSGGSFPRSMEISKDGSLVVVGNQKTQNVVVFRRDVGNGGFGPVVGNVTLSGEVIDVIFGA